jgi:hypothetical protein
MLIGAPSAALDRKHALLRNSGYDVTRADTICHAEVFAESHTFEAAIYDDSLSPQEQVSLARIMQIRWPWIHLIRCGHTPLPIADDALFHCTAPSEAHLRICLARLLNPRSQ